MDSRKAPGATTSTSVGRVGLRARLFIPAAALAAFLGFSWLYLSNPLAYHAALHFLGIPQMHSGYFPFGDLQYALAGVQCWADGLNVYRIDPCDALGRLQAYSPLWLRLSFLPSPTNTSITAVAMDLTFIASLFAIVQKRPRLSELIVLACSTLSPSVAYAMERANVDIAIFLVVIGAALISSRLPGRLMGYTAIVIVGLLKFYPLVLLGLVIRERTKIAVTIAVICGAVLAAFVWHFHAELAELAPNIPRGSYFADSFGAANLPDGISVALFRAHALSA